MVGDSVWCQADSCEMQSQGSLWISKLLELSCYYFLSCKFPIVLSFIADIHLSFRFYNFLCHHNPKAVKAVLHFMWNTPDSWRLLIFWTSLALSVTTNSCFYLVLSKSSGTQITHKSPCLLRKAAQFSAVGMGISLWLFSLNRDLWHRETELEIPALQSLWLLKWSSRTEFSKGMTGYLEV
jgi:hypothetical protein